MPSLTPETGRSGIDRARTAPDDGGYVLVMLALLIVLLMAFAGYSVDVGNWNLQQNKATTAAEAAALGGVAFLPDDDLTAIATAEQIARNHGFADTEISVAVGDAPNKLDVVLTREVDNFFVRVIGNTSTDIIGRATAEFAQPVEMGSPEYILGNNPETGYAPDYWLSIASRNVLKDHGDRFATRWCSASTAACSGPNNVEYDTTGYKYAVHVTDVTQPVRIQVFDPAWTWVGSTCAVPDWPTPAELATLEALNGTHPKIPAGYYDAASGRYEGGEGPYCTGDDRPGSSGPATQFSVHRPDFSHWDDNDNVAVAGCTTTFPARQPTNPFGPPTISIFEYLDSTDGVGGSEWQVDYVAPWTFAETFRRWVTICEIPAAELELGDYIVKVRTTNSTAGQNRFSLRAGPPLGVNDVADVGQSIFARGRFPIFANTDDADISFFLARVPPSADERLLRVSFFDVGDASAAGTLTVVPPPDSNMPAFTTCDFRLSSGAPLFPGPDCSLSNVLDSNGFGEQIVFVDVTIPPTYWCDFTVPDNCWVSVRAQFPGGITDSTTWTAQLIGDAIRLVES